MDLTKLTYRWQIYTAPENVQAIKKPRCLAPKIQFFALSACALLGDALMQFLIASKTSPSQSISPLDRVSSETKGIY